MSQTKLLAVTGTPILHSKSPNMFNSAFKAMGIDATYFRLAADSAEEAIGVIKKLNITGVNVTAPFKEDVMPLLDWIDKDAELIGGVNTIVNENGSLKGYNTDHRGVADSLLQAGVELKGKKCVVLGAGGAGKAAAFGLITEGADVTIVNRTVSKAETAANAMGCNFAGMDQLEALLKDAEVVVSSLAQNINPVKQEWLSKEQVIFDANYKNSEFGATARAVGCQIIEGLDWLLNQAIPAFKHFLDIEPDRTAMKAGLDSADLHLRQKTVSLIGFMGAGKTSNGKRLSKKLERKFGDTDNMIVDQEHRSIPEIFKTDGEAYFRNVEREVLQKAAQADVDYILSCGGGIVLNDENRTTLEQTTLPIWLYASPELTIKRIKPGSRPLLDVENPVETAQQILDERVAYYAQAAEMFFNTDYKSQEQIVEKLYEEISKAFGN